MKNKITFFTVLVFCSLLTSCVTHREFYGSGQNLNNNQQQILVGSHLEMNVSCLGETTNGGRYILFSLPNENSEVVIFYPPLTPDEGLRAEIGAKQTYAWRVEFAQTNSIVEEVTNAHNQMSAWFIEGKQFDCARLVLGVSQFDLSDARRKRLHGQIEIAWSSSAEFRFGVDLSDDEGATILRGEFVSYKALWKPLVAPAVLIFGEEGPRVQKFNTPLQKSNIKNMIRPANINITVDGNINHSGDYLAPEGTTLSALIRVAGGLKNQSNSNVVYVNRRGKNGDETWRLNLSESMTGGFILIQGDNVSVQAE
jgi:hypothetical protein